MAPDIEVIAHRGSSYLAPENTLAAFQLGWEETTTCELDIRPTLDGKLIVIHDESTRRTTGADLKVSEHTLHELQQLDAGSHKGASWKHERLASLAEVISVIPAQKRLLIEMKAGPAMVPELERVISEGGKANQLFLQSFDFACCAFAKETFPRTPVHLLIEVEATTNSSALSGAIERAISKALQARLDGINPDHLTLLGSDSVQRIQSAGLRVYAWTVDDVNRARRLIDLGVNGLITNRPGWLRAQLGFCAEETPR